jgi:type II secretory pathway pseudopilin PulG
MSSDSNAGSEKILRRCNSATSHRGISLAELLAVAVLIGILAAVILSRVTANSAESRKKTCYINKGEIEVQVQLWYRNKNAWPAVNLSDIGADAAYFPSGLPTCPVDGSAYTIDPTTHRVSGHTH